MDVSTRVTIDIMVADMNVISQIMAIKFRVEVTKSLQTYLYTSPKCKDKLNSYSGNELLLWESFYI